MAENALLVTLCSFAALVLAYLFYGRFLAKRVFGLDPRRRTPAHQLEDGVDYVPTRIPVLFGHHFASIAGLGPILGPAIAVIWGWLPAVLWVVIGCIFLGAVHDLGALTVSLRYKGRSVGDICRDLIGPRARLLFLFIIFFLMSLAMGAFVNAISSLFVNFNPDAILPSLGLMLVAMAVGVAVYKLRVGLGPATVVGLLAFAGLIGWGEKQPIVTYEWLLPAETRQVLTQAKDAPQPPGVPAFDSPYGANSAIQYLTVSGHASAVKDVQTAVTTTQWYWIWTLLAYGFIASVLPVWLLLQPRDYINSFQLYFALTFMVIGLVVAAAVGSDFNHINAEPIRYVADAPPMIPILFVTIACGAISGFHSLVSSGTTVRQLNRETDALPVGFGAMLTEGALAVLVIMACVAGLGAAAWQPGGTYGAWKSISGGGNLGAQLNAVVMGGANFLSTVGIPVKYGSTFLAVTVVAFALTTLDSATRLLRFNVEEIFRSLKMDRLANRYVASLIAVCGIAMFAVVPAGKTLWILFGTTNQLLAGLTLSTVSLFLYKLSRPVIYTLVPMLFMLSVTIWAMLDSIWTFAANQQWLLLSFSFIILAMSFWLLVEAALSFSRGRGGLDLEDETKKEDHKADEIAASAHLG
ncbi:MAG: carbon starvation protein A [Gemmataceae bacterium]